MTRSSLVHEILSSKDRENVEFPGTGVMEDFLNFGFSFVEDQDHMVSYVVSNSKTIRKILCSVSEATLEPDDPYLGSLWTAKIVLSNKVRGDKIVFSSHDKSVVLNLNVTDKIESTSY